MKGLFLIFLIVLSLVFGAALTACKSPTGLARFVLTKDDLPAEFQDVTSSFVNQLTGQQASEATGGVFAFDSGDQLLFGTVLNVDDETAAGDLDRQILSGEFVDPDTLDLAIEKDELSDLDNIGDVSGGWTLLSDEPAGRWRLDVVAFRRGDIWARVMAWYPDGQEPPFDVREAARIIDTRISNADAG